MSDEQSLLVIDTKFYVKTLVANYGKSLLRSEHLYQLFSYLRNFSESKYGAGKEVSGLLLYPTTEQELDLKYGIHGHRIRIYTVNLNQEWEGISNDLLASVVW